MPTIAARTLRIGLPPEEAFHRWSDAAEQLLSADIGGRLVTRSSELRTSWRVGEDERGEALFEPARDGATRIELRVEAEGQETAQRRLQQISGRLGDALGGVEGGIDPPAVRVEPDPDRAESEHTDRDQPL